MVLCDLFAWMIHTSNGQSKDPWGHKPRNALHYSEHILFSTEPQEATNKAEQIA